MRRDESGATSGRPVTYEQAVYGSFAFWHRGYALLARSPGCRAEWLADLRAACGGTASDQRLHAPDSPARPILRDAVGRGPMRRVADKLQNDSENTDS